MTDLPPLSISAPIVSLPPFIFAFLRARCALRAFVVAFLAARFGGSLSRGWLPRWQASLALLPAMRRLLAILAVERIFAEFA
jgi:hypothetical protein